MDTIFQPELKRGHKVQRAALILALTLIGVLCGSVIHGIRAMAQEGARLQRVNSQISTSAVAATNAAIPPIFRTI
jgi:hypothetical protein